MAQPQALPPAAGCLKRGQLRKGNVLTEQIRLIRGKIRRFALTRFKKRYVDEQASRKQGECNHCGNCCEILFRCPFLITIEDGSSQCSIYEDRPGQCAAFPIDYRDLADVGFECTYSFGQDLLSIDLPKESGQTVPEPQIASRRLNPTRMLPVLLLNRLLNRTR